MESVREEFFSLKAGRVEALFSGPVDGARPTLVFLHEGLGSARMWRDFPFELARKANLGALVFSRHGYGKSAPCQMPRPLDYMEREAAGTLPELLEAGGVKEFILYGHSDGGSIALLYAAGNPAPGLLGVVTEAAHVFCEEVTVASIRKAREEFLHGALAQKLSRHHENLDTAFFGWCDMWLDPGFAAWDFSEKLKKLRCPLLSLQGSGDIYGTMRQLETLQKLAHAQTTVIPGHGHSLHRECPEKVVEVVLPKLTAWTGRP